MIPTPQKNQVSAPQQTQPINSDVMNLISGKKPESSSPVLQKCKDDLKKIMQQHGISADVLIRAGKMAERALQDKKEYPMMIEMAVKEGLIQSENIKKGFDYRLVASGISAGRLAEQIKQEGGV